MEQDIRWRYLSITILMFIFGLGIIIQTTRLQFGKLADEILAKGEEYETAPVDLQPPRGQIYDRWGNLLAGNKTVYEVGVELRDVNEPESVALAVVAVLDNMDYEEVLSWVSRDFVEGETVYFSLAQGISAEKVAVFEEYIQRYELSEGEDMHDISGLVFYPSLQRSYPENDLASNIIGFVGKEVDEDGNPLGYFGVEGKYNLQLTGYGESIEVPNNPNEATFLPEVSMPSSYVLTIDRQIQAMVENVLDEAVEEFQAKSGTVIIMDPETGEILAIGTTPRLNLNKYWLYSRVFPQVTPEEAKQGKQSVPYNRSISQSYEPGSVFKVITMAAALDAGTVDMTTTFFDTGYFDIGGITIRNWDLAGWGEQDMTGCMRHSLNVCLAWIGTEMGASKFYDYLENFGFGQETEIDLYGEVTGRLKIPGDGDWYPSDLGTNTFGQGIAVTPIQMVMAISALANEGQMVIPRVVKASVHDGVQYEYPVRIAGNPISAETATIITEMLAMSLESEASNALISGYRMAGKTGTAEIPTKLGYTRAITNASFVGWGPVDDPEFIVYVWLEEPQTSIWGSATAAPLFNRIVERLVVLLNLPPDDVRIGMLEP